MAVNLESIILAALFDRFQCQPGSCEMTIGELYNAIDVSPNDSEQVREVQRHLLALKNKGWVSSRILPDGSSGIVEIMSEGITVAQDRRHLAALMSKPTEPAIALSNVPMTVPISAGPFWMGSSHDNEKPRRRLDLPEYQIGRYPVTNAQYTRFISDTGHNPPDHWDRRNVPAGLADHPVVNVSYEDAEEYCRWLSQMTGKRYRLPTEEEWEKAARGPWPDERDYPWGAWREGCCNTQELGRCCTSSVYEFEQTNSSPFGVVDMAGNVWEWTSSPYRGERNVVRGGSWGNFRDRARVSFRGRYEHGTRRPYLGFRVACDVVPSLQSLQPQAGDTQEMRAVSPTLVQPRTAEAITPEISEEMIDLAKLRQNIAAHFDGGDMEILCHDLNLPYGNLSRPREDTTALQIVKHCEKRGRLVELLDYCQRKCSHVDWQSIVRKDSDG
ncbi:MAG: formylglycine-generating enzyme family protein [Anaerolineae bacterium]|nr:formylglycine-generating enzyme family protein [Anaerolineae bacterium]